MDTKLFITLYKYMINHNTFLILLITLNVGFQKNIDGMHTHRPRAASEPILIPTKGKKNSALQAKANALACSTAAFSLPLPKRLPFSSPSHADWQISSPTASTESVAAQPFSPFVTFEQEKALGIRQLTESQTENINDLDKTKSSQTFFTFAELLSLSRSLQEMPPTEYLHTDSSSPNDHDFNDLTFFNQKLE